MASDSSQYLKRLPLVVGALGGTLLLLNRGLTSAISTSQSRSDALGIILSALLILTGLLWQQVQPKPPEAVELEGEEGFDLDESLPEPVKVELAWMSKLLLTNTTTKSLLVWYDDRVIARRGILNNDEEMEEPGIIVDRVMDTEKAVYLVDLKLYPGRIEFNYLPKNIQGLICHPLPDLREDGEESRGALILAANAPRSYTQQDEAWIEAMAQKLAQNLDQHMEAPDD